jgi:hypothetical protein
VTNRQTIFNCTDTQLVALPGVRVWHNAGRPSWVEVREDGSVTLGHAGHWRIFPAAELNEQSRSGVESLIPAFSG